MVHLAKILSTITTLTAANDNCALFLAVNNHTTTYPASSGENVTFTYDQSGHGKGVGKLTSLTDPAGTLSLSYDERGLLTARNRTSGASTMNTAYSYNAAGRLASITYPSGAVVGYTRDASGNIASVTYTPFGGASTTVATYAGYVPFGPPTSLALGNGVTTSYAYDHDVNLTTLTDNSSLQNLTYAYDNANNVSSITDALTAANTQTFGYDVLDRLTSATSGSGGYGTLLYAYNANGNRTSATVNGTATTYTTTTATNRLTAVGAQSISYNGNGNITTMITGGTTNYAFTYNNANRLATTTTPTSTTTNTYDAFGTRFKKVTGANTTLYVTGAGNQMLEEDTNGTKTDYVYANGMTIASFSGGNLSYIHTDRMGTPQKATDASKATIWATTYEPYGKTAAITGSLTQNVRLPGQMFDSESGIYQNGQRDYASWLGRYLESDPIGLGGGLNSFAYVRENPLKRIDPWGLLDRNHYPWEPRPEDRMTRQQIFLARGVMELLKPNGYSEAGHADINNMYDSSGYGLTANDLASEITSDTINYKKGETVILYACSTGQGDNSFAQKLSTILGADVIAPDDRLWITANDAGDAITGMGIGPEINGRNVDTGHWRIFHPDPVNNPPSFVPPPK